MTKLTCQKCRVATVNVPSKHIVSLDRRGSMSGNRESGPHFDPKPLKQFLEPLGWKVEEYTRGCNDAEGGHGCPSDWTFHELSIRCPDCSGYWEDWGKELESKRRAAEEAQRQRRLEEQRIEEQKATAAQELASRAEPIVPTMLGLLDEHRPDAIRAALAEAGRRRKRDGLDNPDQDR